MKRALIVTCLGSVLLSAVVAGQTKPSFSGTWKLIPSTDAALVVTEFTVVQDAKTFTVTATTPQMGPIKTIYNLDGSEAKSPLDLNGTAIDRVTKAAWDGNKLVLTTTSDFNGQTFETKQVWSLAADGNLVVEATRPDFQNGGAPVTTKATYKKN